MLAPILVCHALPVGEKALKRGIHDQFLADGVARQLPGELVLVARLLVLVLGLGDAVVVRLELAVALLDGVYETRHGDAGMREETSLVGEMWVFGLSEVVCWSSVHCYNGQCVRRVARVACCAVRYIPFAGPSRDSRPES